MNLHEANLNIFYLISIKDLQISTEKNTKISLNFLIISIYYPRAGTETH